MVSWEALREEPVTSHAKPYTSEYTTVYESVIYIDNTTFSMRLTFDY